MVASSAQQTGTVSGSATGAAARKTVLEEYDPLGPGNQANAPGQEEGRVAGHRVTNEPFPATSIPSEAPALGTMVEMPKASMCENVVFAPSAEVKRGARAHEAKALLGKIEAAFADQHRLQRRLQFVKVQHI